MVDATQFQLSQGMFQDFGQAASDLFAGFAASERIAGIKLEGQSYSEAAALARQNERYTEMSTAIQEAQSQRELYLSTGRTAAQVAGAGFTAGGSGLDILRSSASQGALQKAVIGEQGLITEAGYQEQARSYDLMASAAQAAVKGEKIAQIGDFVAAGLQGGGGFAAALALL